MKINAKSQEEIRIANLILERVITFPLARESDRVQVHEHGNKTAIAYLTSSSQIRSGTTHFELELREDICDVLGIGIEEKHLSKGYGTQLYKTIEDFARTYGCKRIQTTKSGMGKSFWPSMGFFMPCEFGVEKQL